MLNIMMTRAQDECILKMKEGYTVPRKTLQYTDKTVNFDISRRLRQMKLLHTIENVLKCEE